MTINKDIKNIFDCWNSLGIIKHREIGKFRNHISARLKHYTVDEVTEAMTNYSIIIGSSDYFFDYRWTLKEFLLRGIDKFLTENDPFNRYKNKYASPYGKEFSEMTEKNKQWRNATDDEREELKKKWAKELEGE
jgi:uncharacterized protein with ATP-grasp and redox domains